MTSLLSAGRVRFVPAGLVTVLALSVGVLALTVTTRPVRLDAAAPAERQTLDAPPGAVTLSFSARPDPDRTHVTVVAVAGDEVTSEPASVSGSTVTQPVSILDRGTYRVGYHATFAGSRELSGQFTFAVGGTGPTRSPSASLSSTA